MISGKRSVLSKYIYPLFYVVFSTALVISACFIFDRNYYTNIYVSGQSMLPTLMGGTEGRAHYGIADTSYYARKNIKRFDVVVTLFPETWGTGDSLKVKRAWGFPNEHISLTYNDSSQPVFTVESAGNVETYIGEASHSKNFMFEKYKGDDSKEIIDYVKPMNVFTFHTAYKSFDVSANMRAFDIYLKDNEYFLMGDNWGSSTDSYDKRAVSPRVGLEHIQGRVVCIEGTAEYSVESKSLILKRAIAPKYLF